MDKSDDIWERLDKLISDPTAYLNPLLAKAINPTIQKAWKDMSADRKTLFRDYSAPPAHSGRSSAQPDRASAHLIQSAVQPMLAADQHTC